ncbi:hypothetical protein AQ490_12220 [Wenjunlia vitaminophila]|uniref:AB hydrolase-1 domain-containing protein n=1 Tax=Wenjunlia vitaminophila TaxID=76728 RepID=A0A0T6LKR2_WENVI|nr:alpha/beta fold hydrolase [Wenjunlia vitaminophila]KRV46630.1 hypothetical protein AQ490_12220 [Wenjunlia vitaminophila]
MSDEPDGTRPAPTRPGAAVVLLHGFGTGPGIWRHVEPRLREQGYRTFTPRLPGHGTVPPALAEVHWSDWASATERALARARDECPTVFVVGHSLGATLALHAAASERPPDAAVLMAPSIRISVRDRLTLAGYALARRDTVPWRRIGLNGPPSGARGNSPAARGMPVSALCTNLRLKAAVAAAARRVHCPVAIIGGAEDPLVPAAELRRVEARLRSAATSLHVLPRSGHAVPLAADREEACRLTLAFLAAVPRRAPAAPTRP